MSALETIFPTTASIAGKSNLQLALHVAQLWMDGVVSASPLYGPQLDAAVGDLVLAGESVWVVDYVHSDPVADVELWLLGTEETDSAMLRELVQTHNHVYRINLA